MAIQVLSELLAAQIAAGEVIERPASVVKELIENALDAGATEVRVEVRDGGKRLIRIGDNGAGIRRDEAELAFVHHATSKLQTADDLFAIHTLGFRGEALPSIAAVAQVTMLTRAADDVVGTELKLAGGRVVSNTPHAAPQGTLISVENLFFNIPARLKFLKSTNTESGHVHELVNRYALAYSHVRFTFMSEGRLAFQSSGSGNMSDVLVVVFGGETAKQMIEVQRAKPNVQRDDLLMSSDVEPRTLDIDVSGFISSPSLTRANRSHMTLFVNGRVVQDRTLLFAITDAYHTFLQAGRFPVCILKISVPSERVDVNVHPTKAEVRFREPHLAFSALQRAVRETLLAQQHAPNIQVDSVAWGVERGMLAGPPEDQLPMHMRLVPRKGDAPDLSQVEGWRVTSDENPDNSLNSIVSNLQSQVSALPPPIASLRPPAEPTSQQTNQQTHSALPLLRVLGQVARTYIIAEGPEGIFLIDQHAAHERVLYEKFMAQRMQSGDGANAQPLLEPLTVELSPQQAARLRDALELFRKTGFDVEPFGGTTVLLRAVPTIMGEGDPRRALSIILDELAGEDDGHGDPLRAQREAMLIASVCKQSAIKAGRLLALPEMQALIEQLEHSQSPRTCPHGRPTMIRLGFEQLAREFGRQ